MCASTVDTSEVRTPGDSEPSVETPVRPWFRSNVSRGKAARGLSVVAVDFLAVALGCHDDPAARYGYSPPQVPSNIPFLVKGSDRVRLGHPDYENGYLNLHDYTIVVFEWHDHEATDARAAYTTGERQEDLVEWQTHNASGSRPSIEVISPEEACDMATRLVCYNLIVRNGEPSPPVGGSGWTMQFSLPKSKYYMDLGASDECQVVLSKIRHALDGDHLAPVDYVLNQVASRKTSGPPVERSPAEEGRDPSPMRP